MQARGRRKELCKPFQRGNAFAHLHAQAVQDVDDGCRILFGKAQAFEHLFAAGLADAAVHHGKILRRDVDGITVDGGKPGHDAFAFRLFIVEIVFGKAEPGKLDKAVGIDASGDRLADGGTCRQYLRAPRLQQLDLIHNTSMATFEYKSFLLYPIFDEKANF